MSSREACRRVGVDPRRGKMWRNGRVPKPRGGRAEVSGRFLSESERVHIADRCRERAGVRVIARELGRDPSTVSRELRRNCQQNGAYRPHGAHARARARRPRPKRGKIARDGRLRQVVETKLGHQWSPEQIAAYLRRRFPGQPDRHVVHETIYQAMYHRHRGRLRQHSCRQLRSGRRRRRSRRETRQRQHFFVTPSVMLDHRPAEAADRAVPGHWEGDLLIGRNNATAIITLVERTTRYVTLVALPWGQTPQHVNTALRRSLARVPRHLTRTLTWDQGSELAYHEEFTARTGIPVFFCDAASPWQRGSNENTNRLLRQYFPKGTDPPRQQTQLTDIARELNTRPRKTLNWDTPKHRWTTLLTSK
ncbi:IS30 family transposase [Actinopolyspora xinjiangensis]|uniref:IS30 family transposase n=1 Tax=Actinopolyspora xinjiangensis TaxID=405564 RepID=UPI003CC7AFC8